jgi:hypothetical protein
MTLRARTPRYDAAQSELAECRRLGLGYSASCPISFLVLEADEARRRGEMISAAALETASMIVARAQAVAIVASRRGHRRAKPRPMSRRSVS